LWQAKYSTWMTPEKPEHALVYMAEEVERGVIFPRELDETVKKLLENQH
jgi:hypothetical protein